MLIAASIGSPTPDLEDLIVGCTEGNNLPDFTNCSAYFVCSNDELLPRFCPSGLHFNADLKVCDYPGSAKCEWDTEFEVNDCPKTDDPMHLGHPKCDMYYICNYGVPYEQRCSKGLHWNIAKNVCDWKDEANCEEGASSAQPGAVLLPGGDINPDKPDESVETL